jgi:hypothetical protein
MSEKINLYVIENEESEKVGELNQDNFKGSTIGLFADAIKGNLGSQSFHDQEVLALDGETLQGKPVEIVSEYINMVIENSEREIEKNHFALEYEKDGQVKNTAIFSALEALASIASGFQPSKNASGRSVEKEAVLSL